jgi:hypothetical protein
MKRIAFAIHNPHALKTSGTKQLLMGLVLAAAFTAPHRMLAAGPAPIDLKSAAHFAILATATTTTTGGGIINGDVGLSPVGSQGIPPGQINGTIYNGGPIAAPGTTRLERRDYRRQPGSTSRRH